MRRRGGCEQCPCRAEPRDGLEQENDMEQRERCGLGDAVEGLAEGWASGEGEEGESGEEERWAGEEG